MLKWMCLFLFLASTLVFADNTARDYSRYQATVHAQSGSVLQEMKAFSPESLKDYSENPSEAQYYQGIRAEDSALAKSARDRVAQDNVGRETFDNFTSRARFEINPQSASIKNAKAIIDDSHAIVTGVDDSCQEVAAQCTSSYTQKTCFADNSAAIQRCHMTRHIEVKSVQSSQAVRVSFLAYFMSSDQEVAIDFAHNLVSTDFGPVPGVEFSSAWQMPSDCQSMSAVIKKVMFGWQDVSLQSAILVSPLCNHGSLSMHLPVAPLGYKITVELQIDTQSDAHVIRDEWFGECEPRESDQCYFHSSTCLFPDDTRDIGGVAVTRDCWEKEDRYQCPVSNLDGCETLKSQGCNQIGSRCGQLNDGVCQRFEQVYQCPVEQCVAPVVCAKKVFCADGSCVDTQPTHNDDFGASVSKLAAVSEAGVSYQETHVSMFAGKVKSCKVHPLNYLDCCSNKGWGKKLNLANCSDEDRALGTKKKHYLVHYLGQYCSHRDPILHSCLTHKNVYCVFDSKTARIMQEARLSQLSAASLGSAKNPICGGMSPEELQHIDMSRVDFTSPIYPAPPAPDGKALIDAGIAADLSVDAPSDEVALDEITRRMSDRLESVS